MLSLYGQVRMRRRGAVHVQLASVQREHSAYGMLLQALYKLSQLNRRIFGRGRAATPGSRALLVRVSNKSSSQLARCRQ